MKLFVPACGDRLTLTRDWAFDLYLEHRNMRFAKILGLVEKESWDVHEGDGVARAFGTEYKPKVLARVHAVLPKGTMLECDRVYIRTFNKGRIQEGDDYDSITWRVIGKNGKPATHQRFWCKLSAACEIEYEIALDGLYRDRVKLMKSVHEV
jgi:hypothetical protein